MKVIDNFLDHVSVDHYYNNRAFKFFICFSRFEYALKRAGFIYLQGKSTVAHASIEKFIKEVEKEIDLTAEPIKSSVDYIVSQPPKKLHLVEDNLVWTNDCIPKRTLSFIFECMRIARNNLFHGNKQMAGNNTDRNAYLINAFLVVLNEVLVCHEAVRKYFSETH